MHIYFSGSIRGSPSNKETYKQIIAFLSKYGTVLTEKTFDHSFEEEVRFDEKSIWERDMNWIKQCNVLIAEVTAPSLGVGYEIAFARQLNKPILCLYQVEKGKKISAMLLGDPNLMIYQYSNVYDACNKIDEWFTNNKINNI